MKRKRGACRCVPLLLLALLITFSFTGCRGAPEGGSAEPVVSDSSGVRIVENLAADFPLPLRVKDLGTLATPDEALTAAPWGVAADPRIGQVYVVDRTGHRVAIFDQDGRYVGQFGREGQGPGEFLNPAAAAIGPDGSVTIWDAGRGILSRWSSQGDLLNEQRAPVPYWGPAFQEHPAGLVTVTTASSEQALLQQLVEVRGAEVRVLHTLPRELVMMQLPCISQPASRVFAPSILWTARSDTIYVLKGPGYRIDAYVGKTVQRSVRRHIEPITVTESMASERAAREYAALIRLCNLHPEAVVRSVGHEELASPIQTMASNPDGQLWVSRSLDGRGPIPVDVFDSDGVYKGTVTDAVMPVAFLSNTRFVGMAVEAETDEVILSLHELEASSELPAGTDGVSSTRLHPDVREVRDCSDCPAMMVLPLGRYLMGAPEGEDELAGSGDRPLWTAAAERPQVEVTIDAPFAISRFPVTFAQWDRCVEAGGCSHVPDDEGWGRGDRPVIHVNRSDAGEYLRWLTRITGKPYRLPSEAEWEYAARAGSTTARWWGDELGSGNAVCDGCGTRWDDRSTAPVGSLAPNPFGLYDMLGNVAEWVADCWHDNHDDAPGHGAPRITTSPWWDGDNCTRPVQRGGAFSYFTWTVRAAKRSYYHEWPAAPWTDRDSNSVGFRVARDVAPSPSPDSLSTTDHSGGGTGTGGVERALGRPGGSSSSVMSWAARLTWLATVLGETSSTSASFVVRKPVIPDEDEHLAPPWRQRIDGPTERIGDSKALSRAEAR